MSPEPICESREGQYVPWSWGELFACSACGWQVRQHHNTPPIGRTKRADYDALYPIPEHVAELSGVRGE